MHICNKFQIEHCQLLLQVQSCQNSFNVKYATTNVWSIKIGAVSFSNGRFQNGPLFVKIVEVGLKSTNAHTLSLVS